MNKVIEMPRKNKSNILFQQTIQDEIHCNGIGLHSGKDINMTFMPAEANTGIVFIRTDLEDGKNIIKATWDNVVDTKLCTVVANEFGASVGTVEHLVSAVRGCGIDNILIEIDGAEVPIMDGSSEPFVFLFDCAGIKQQNEKRKAIKVLKEIVVDEGNKSVVMTPAEKSSFSFSIDFDSKAIGKQDKDMHLDETAFKKEISRARTFGMLKDVEALKSMGLALGGSLENAVVVEDDKILNENGLRYADEFVRHKILDSIGDLFLAGAPIIGKFHGIKSGHDLNNKLLRAIFADKSAWEMVDMTVEDEMNAAFNLKMAM
ncbi:MAG: UDP-3-O-acyl-N-acetylglucosamine deacetylase [Alphaproteobacteria bacterium]|jgi:UDP-3-O-[3-hydroxymyristoyl] N-acetylglucosamine deacetylase|nr:UDP-3-O-acyl-N-acetylglucosamine deacetylase [Alphaproteobacteria bacterium]